MDQRPYFIFGDVLASALSGMAAGCLSILFVSTSWPMLLAMALMMTLGMIVGILIFVPLSIFFGAMEIMIPCMLCGMVSGMLVGMWASMQSLGLVGGLVLGMESALSTLLFIWIANAQWRGEKFYNQHSSASAQNTEEQ